MNAFRASENWLAFEAFAPHQLRENSVKKIQSKTVQLIGDKSENSSDKNNTCITISILFINQITSLQIDLKDHLKITDYFQHDQLGKPQLMSL